MDWVKLILLSVTLACFGSSANGQTTDVYFDLGTGIRQNANALSAGATVVTPGERYMCYSGSQVYFTNGAQVLNEDGTAVFTTPNNAVIRGLTCCCQTVAVTYQSGANTIVYIYDQNIDEIVVIHELSDIDTEVPLACETGPKKLFAASVRTVWIFDLDILSDAPTVVTTTQNFARPRCISVKDTPGGTFDYEMFVAASGTSIQVVSIKIDGATITTSVASTSILNTNSDPVTVTCIDYDAQSDEVYYLGGVDGGNFQVRRVSANALDFGTLVQDTTTAQDDDITGIAVCGPDCQSSTACNAATCSCASETCGFCLSQSTVCQCENSNTGTCMYQNTESAAECEECIAAQDLCLAIYTPEFKRRTAGEVKVAGVATTDHTIVVERYITTGRFNTANWARPYQSTALASTMNPWVEGFSAPLTSRLRGSRAGVYVGKFTTGGDTEVIPGIVAENSGFYQILYTYTVSNGENVVLGVQTNAYVVRYKSKFIWRFVPIDDDTGNAGTIQKNIGSSMCNNPADKATCSLTSVTKAGNEGVYEVYRPGRRLRNWHPIIYLFVRHCASGMYGRTCSGVCATTCDNGMCDPYCGTCICSPGWMGTNCDTPCDNGDEFGQACSLSCSTVFPGTSMCRGIQICNPRKAGCACRSGLQPPRCEEDCSDATKWGPNCLETCPTSCPTTCNKRTGMCP